MKRLSLLFLLGFFAACAGSTTPTVHQPEVTPVAPPRPASPNALRALSSAPKSIVAPVIRVGLLSDQSTVRFPRIEGGYLFVAAAGAASSLRRGFIATAPQSGVTVHYAIQVASLSDRKSVDALVQRLQSENGLRADAIFDASAANGGLYRIYAGEFPDAATAAPVRDDLERRGYPHDMIVTRRPSLQPVDKAIVIRDDEGESTTIAGESLLVLPASADAISIADKPYRTAARLFVNDRGLLNVINELNLEDYLRGVVPAEMGPKIYDEIEALKAQAVAARTYAVRNRNGYAREGFDICPGPACQAYLGLSGEDPLSSRAVAETAGLVITWQGVPIDALYTATCGGETSDVGTMFPGRNDPYLKRARCVELDTIALAGRADSGILTESQVNARMFAALAGIPESGSAWSAREVAASVAAAARLIGWPSPVTAAPASSRRGDVLRYLAAVFSLDRNGQTLTLPEDRRYFFPQSGDAQSPEYEAAAFLIKYGVWPAQEIDRVDLSTAISREELYGVLASWIRKHDLLAEANGKIAGLSARRLTIRNEGKSTSYDLPAGIPIYRRLGDRFQEYARVPVMVGDRAVVELDARHNVVALIVVANYDGASFDRTSSFANWTRSYRAPELVTSIRARNPIQELHDLRVVNVDASQRVISLEVTAEAGRTFTLQGLPIRWSLNLPDNLFVMEKTKDEDGVDRYTFYGKGWGHGVGLCQVGAYGMAFRGFKYDQILRQYYANVEIEPMKQ